MIIEYNNQMGHVCSTYLNYVQVINYGKFYIFVRYKYFFSKTIDQVKIKLWDYDLYFDMRKNQFHSNEKIIKLMIEHQIELGKTKDDLLFDIKNIAEFLEKTNEKIPIENSFLFFSILLSIVNQIIIL